VVAATHERCSFPGTTAQPSHPRDLASYVTNIRGVTLASDSQILWRPGKARSQQRSGATWEHVLTGLPDKDITSYHYDATGKRMLATSLQTGVIFQNTDSGRTWQRGPDSGIRCRACRRGARTFHRRKPRLTAVIAQPETSRRAQRRARWCSN